MPMCINTIVFNVTIQPLFIAAMMTCLFGVMEGSNGIHYSKANVGGRSQLAGVLTVIQRQ